MLPGGGFDPYGCSLGDAFPDGASYAVNDWGPELVEALCSAL